ncbi:MAG: hypothetical protein ACKOPS_18725 [Cyanobium sp.]
MQRAEAAWRQAAQLAPNTPEPQARLGFLYDLRGELPQAKAAYERARDLEPSTTTAARGFRIALADLSGEGGGKLLAEEVEGRGPHGRQEAALLAGAVEHQQIPAAIDGEAPAGGRGACVAQGALQL